MAASDIQEQQSPEWECVIENFAVTIKSHYVLRKDIWRHFLVNVQEGGPADAMGILDKDEIIVVNGTDLVEDETHKEVVDLFNNAQFDGETKFSLVVRREKKSRGDDTGVSTEGVLYDTSAVLATEDDRRITKDGRHAEFVEPKVNVTSGTVYLQVTSAPGYYLTVADGRVCADVMQNRGSNDAMLITMKEMFKKDREFYVTLQGGSNKEYIAINEGEVVIQDSPFIFSFTEESYKICFRQETGPLYISGGDRVEDIVAKPTKFYFLKFPVLLKKKDRTSCILL